ncbi:MAG: enterotoxin [Acidobacteriota bacterium]
MRQALSITLLLAATAAHAQTFSNQTVAAHVDTTAGHLTLTSFEDLRTHATLPLGEPFVLIFSDNRTLAASQMKLASRLKASSLAADPQASRAAEHLPGRQLCATLADPQSPLRATWCLVSRGDSPYLRQQLTLTSGSEAASIADVRLFSFTNSQAKVVGTVAGSPIVTGTFYLGTEYPLAYSDVTNAQVTSGLKRALPLPAHQSITYSSVVGSARPTQLRRDFLAYVEQERAHPYRTFLHYNSWYDIGYGERFSAADVLDRMNAFGTELVQKRHVTLDSFLLDDGWDDTHSLWGFDSGFPKGLTPLSATARKYNFGIGVWMSPWGGYSKEKQERIAYGTAQGYEIVKGGYALSGPRYYAKFEQTTLNFINKYGVNQFKFDGTGNVSQVIPGSAFDSDFSAAIHLIETLRKASPTVFINLTTGTKPSPFWLRYADSIWRGGEDHAFAGVADWRHRDSISAAETSDRSGHGVGSWRQRWITYRDAETYRNIVLGGPLYPLNSLMLHGILYAKQAQHLTDDPANDFTDEVHSYFGTGTQLQEMYITPSLLSQQNWDDLAESAIWSRANTQILCDTHWIGGDPAQLQPYGWASWNADHGIIVLRNPSDKPQSITIDIAEAFELPPNSAHHYTAHSPWKSDAAQPTVALDAGDPHTFTLAPFQVITLDANPKP